MRNVMNGWRRSSIGERIVLGGVAGLLFVCGFGFASVLLVALPAARSTGTGTNGMQPVTPIQITASPSRAATVTSPGTAVVPSIPTGAATVVQLPGRTATSSSETDSTPVAPTDQVVLPIPTVFVEIIPTATNTRSAATTTPAPTVQFVLVQGAAPRGIARISVQTAAGASCSISYVTPAGTESQAQGLVNKTADQAGRVSWSWTIGSSTRPGTGTVTVTCNGVRTKTPITIG